MNGAPILNIPVQIFDSQVSLTIDTGECCNIISESAYKHLCESKQVQSEITDINLNRLTGHKLNVMGKATLPIRLTNNTHAIYATLFIIRNYDLPSDGLLGLPILSKHGIDISPKDKKISFRKVDIHGQQMPCAYLNTASITQPANSNTNLAIKAIAMHDCVI